MCDLKNIKIHNNYHYQLISENGEIIEEHTIYNEARSGLYVAQVGTGAPSNVALTIYYNKIRKDNEGNRIVDESESLIRVGVPIYRITKAENVFYGSTIEYGGSTDFLASDFVGIIKRFCLGPGYTPRNDNWNNNNETPVTYYWSEAGGGGEKGETVSLHVDITIYMSTSKPSISSAYDESISSILHRESPTMLTPAPKWVGLSSINLSYLPNRSTLNKRIPIAFTIPMEGEGLPESNSYKVFSPTTSVERDGVTILNSKTGNYGSLFSMVFGEIGAIPIGGLCDNIYIPVIILTPQKIQNLLDKRLDKYTFFGSVPPGCSYKNMVINGVPANSELTWRDPSNITKMSPSSIGMEENEFKTIDDYRNTEIGNYYANCLLGGCWEPPSGTSTCPKYLYFNSAPNNIYVGANTGATVQVKVNNAWTTVGTSRTYETVYFDYSDFSNIQGYRVIISAPTENSKFYVNEAESLTVPNKSFDPNVLCIGSEDNDFGEAGITIDYNQLELFGNSIFRDQTVSGYNIGINVSASCFYKSSNTIAYINYGVTASG